MERCPVRVGSLSGRCRAAAAAAPPWRGGIPPCRKCHDGDMAAGRHRTTPQSGLVSVSRAGRQESPEEEGVQPCGEAVDVAGDNDPFRPVLNYHRQRNGRRRSTVSRQITPHACHLCWEARVTKSMWWGGSQAWRRSLRLGFAQPQKEVAGLTNEPHTSRATASSVPARKVCNLATI